MKSYTAHNSQLRGLRMIVTPAVVNGKNYWRVAVAGLDGNGAARLCSGLRNGGNACFAYAIDHAPAGAMPELALGGGRMAARRR